MRKIPPFCPLRQNPSFDVDKCERHRHLQEAKLAFGECQCGHCIEEEVDENVR